MRTFDLIKKKIENIFTLGTFKLFFAKKISHLFSWRLWRTGMLFSTKSKGHKSKFRISWMYRSHFFYLKVRFWWPNKRFFWLILSWNTLYYIVHGQSILSMHLLYKIFISFKNLKFSIVLRNTKNDASWMETFFYTRSSKQFIKKVCAIGSLVIFTLCNQYNIKLSLKRKIGI